MQYVQSFLCRCPTILLAFISTICTTVTATSAQPYHNSTLYDTGYLGAYPHRTFSSVDTVEPILNVISWTEHCEHGYYLLTPRGGSVPSPGPLILDGKGNLVWADKSYGDTENLRVQIYNGSNYLTFWAGTDDGTHGRGYYYMLNQHYEAEYVISAVGELDGDLHEFKITAEGTALITVYRDLPYDLSDLNGPADGWLIDSLFQEVDIATGDLVFEWRASDHILVSNTLAPIDGFGRRRTNGFDFFHINSVDKAADGNYYVSSRYMSAVMCISGTDGSIVWQLGGHNSSFTDLSEGEASNFSWQHHMTHLGRRVNEDDDRDPGAEEVLVSLFDNAAFNRHPTTATESRALLISLNTGLMTATLIQDYRNPMTLLSHSQGSVQMLPDTRNIFVGFGHSAAFTEFAPDGQVLCDAHFGAYAFWDFGWAKSYRAFKAEESAWVGRPNTRPDISMGAYQKGVEVIYASWNGATVVDKWRLQGCEGCDVIGDEEQEGLWHDLFERPKEGFEVAFDLDVGRTGPHDHQIRMEALTSRHSELDEEMQHFKVFRIQAMDSSGQVIGVTRSIDRHSRLIYDSTSRDHSTNSSSRLIGDLVLPMIGACILCSMSVLAATVSLDRCRSSSRTSRLRRIVLK